MTDAVKYCECIGGPEDGKVVPVGPAQGEHACMVRVDAEGNSHFYIVVPHKGKDAFMYGGNSAWDLVTILREFNLALADNLAAGLNDQNVPQPKDDFSN